MNRLGALALSLLLLAAVAGPMCLMFASSAMAMSMDMPSAPCDETPGSTVCPYERPDATLSVKAPIAHMVFALATLVAGDAPANVDRFVPVSAGAFALEPPPAHLTPLRI